MAIIPCRFRFSADAARIGRRGTSSLAGEDYCLAGFCPKDFVSAFRQLGQNVRNEGTVRTLRLVQWAMLASIVLYGIAGEVAGSSAGTANASLNYIFTTAGVAMVGVIFVVRRTLVFRSRRGWRFVR